MNLIIAIVLLLSLVTCEFSAPQPVQDVWTHVWAMLITAMIVPGLAAFQTFIVTRRMRDTEVDYSEYHSLLKRLSIAHSAVWMAASLAIVYAIGWHHVVRDNWQLDRWPLIDEALIVLPIVLSLVASWAIFYEIQRALRDHTDPTVNQSQQSRLTRWMKRLTDSKRAKYVSIRFRVYCGLILIPIFITVLIRDLNIPWQSLSNAQSTGILAGLGVLILAAYPFLLMMIWNCRPVSNPQLHETLLNDCRQLRLQVMGIRIWKTNGQILNALVAGVIPRLRLILISDSLVQRFSLTELRAIVRHEAGHIRYHHVLIRMAFMAVPLLMLGSLEFSSLNFLTNLELALENPSSFQHWTIAGCFAVATVLYLVLVMPWLSRNMEHQADLYAAALANEPIGDSNLADDADQADDSNKATALIEALEKFAAFAPDQRDRRSWMHPSLQARIDLVKRATTDPKLTRDFHQGFLWQQIGVATLAGIAILIISLL